MAANNVTVPLAPLHSGLGSIVLLSVLLFSQQIREHLVRAAYRPSKLGVPKKHQHV